MKLPSLRTVYTEARDTLQRFPAVILTAAIGTAAALILANHEGESYPSPLFAVLLSSALTLPVFFLFTLISETLRYSTIKRAALFAFGVVVYIVYFFIVPRDLYNAPFYHAYLFILLLFFACMMVFAVPFFLLNRSHGFWFFNVQLIARFCLSFFYTLVLYLGLLLAIHSLDPLFGIEVSGTRFFQLWIVMLGVFHVWFFLGTVPDSLGSGAGPHFEMKPVKVFVQYILMPILAVYLLILYAYIAKILFAFVWPRGWVSKLILGYGITGFAAYVLIYPMRHEGALTWAKKFWKWFLLSFIPLNIVYFLALMERIGNYGLTENRLAGFILCAWFAFAIIYFLFFRKDDIRMIPLSLGIAALLAAVGPWSIFAIAENSQVERLRAELVKNSILANGRIVKPQHGKNPSNAAAISAALQYLHEQHGYAKIQPWFNVTLRDASYKPNESFRIAGSWKTPEDVAKLLGVEFEAPRAYDDAGNCALKMEEREPLPLNGYERITAVMAVSAEGKKTIGNMNGLFVYSRLDSGYIAFSPDSSLSENTIRIYVSTKLCALAKHAGQYELTVPADKLIFEGESPRLKIRMFVFSAHVVTMKTKESVSWARIQVCYKLKE